MQQYIHIEFLELVKDNYLLVADAGQGKVFQIPITKSKDPSNETKYSIVPLGKRNRNDNVLWKQ